MTIDAHDAEASPRSLEHSVRRVVPVRSHRTRKSKVPTLSASLGDKKVPGDTDNRENCGKRQRERWLAGAPALYLCQLA